jgi:hypothetical protein
MACQEMEIELSGNTGRLNGRKIVLGEGQLAVKTK